MPGVTYFGLTGNNLIDGVLSGVKWDTTDLSFGFPTLATQYHQDYGAELNTFGQLSEAGKTATRTILANYAAVSGLTFTENTATPGAATLRLAISENAADTAYGFYPEVDVTEYGGDVWFSKLQAFEVNAYENPVRGDYAYLSYIHEIGHALGLKHGHETDYTSVNGFNQPDPLFPALPSQYDAMEYTVMTYRSYAGMLLSLGYGNENGGYAQTLMMLDIAAVQQLYGANFTSNSSNTTYTFSTTTGEMFINGAGQGAPTDNRIFLTIWDGGGVDTYDFSNYTENQGINLGAGTSSLMSTVQQANLGDNHYAQGNVYNAMLYQGDLRSLIENANGGSGNDVMTGNQADNVLNGNAGNDNIAGLLGNDIINGGAGNDALDGGANIDTADYSTALTTVTVVLTDLAAGHTGGSATGAMGNDTLTDFENISGGAGNDGLTGNNQANVLVGNGGDDVLNGNAANDILDGGAGTDTASYSAAANTVTLILTEAVGGHTGGSATGALGNDILIDIENLTGGSGNDTITGNNLANILNGGGGNDQLNGGAGNDSLTGAGGIDRFIFAAGGNADTITDFSHAQGDVIDITGISGVYNMAGLAPLATQSGADTLLAFGNGNSLRLVNILFANLVAADFAFAVQTPVSGDGNDNILTGTAIAETILGLGGDDTLQGLGGNDTLDGGTGLDTASYAETSTGVTVTLSNLVAGHTGGASSGSAGIDTLIDIENILGGAGNDILTGNDQNNVLTGGAGNDQLDGGDGNDTIVFDNLDGLVAGGAGIDTGIFEGANVVQARAFDLAAHGIDVLKWIVNGNTYQIIPGSGGTRTETVTDTAGSEATFSQRTTILDSLGREEFVDVISDSGARLVYDYDPSDVQGWNYILQSYSAAEGLDYTDTRYDDLSRVVRDEDQGNHNSWNAITTTYAASGAVDYQDNVYDDLTRIIFDSDQANGSNWATISTTYAANGAVDYQDYIYDDGTRVIFDSDQANATSWSSRTTSYAAGNVLDVQDTTYDDGTRVIFDWDNNSQFYWSTFESFYNSSNVLTTQRVTRDTGEILIFNL